MTFEESKVKFTFSEENWWVIKFDEDKNYTKVRDTLEGTKGIDFLGIYNENTLILIEVKNFRNHTLDASTRERLSNDAEDLTTEIAQKVKDSIACITAASRNTTHNQREWKKACNIISQNKSLFIIAWVEIDPLSSPKKQKSNLLAPINRLKNKLKWLNPKVFIKNIKDESVEFDGLTIEYLSNN